MHTITTRYCTRILTLSAMLLLVWTVAAQATIQGTTGIDVDGNPVFNFTAKAGHITTADGSSVLFWGYADNDGNTRVQYPGPTMLVTQGATVTVNLTNELMEPVSMVFPGHNVAASGGTPGLLTREAPIDRLTTVTYTFDATEPGTYMYYSGSHTDLQVEMGLVGAIIVYPAAVGASPAYDDARSAYDQEYLFILSEMDPRVHNLIEFGRMDQVDIPDFQPVLWFINGRNAPDTMAMNCDATLPTQPYNIMPRMNPGDRMLLRFVGAGRDLHPFHAHGNNFDLIARDGRLLESGTGLFKTAEVGTVPDLAVSDFTQTVAPGATYDAIFTWSGAGLGWDMYGDDAHTCDTPAGFDTITHEYCPDHGKPFPVQLPGTNELTFGAAYSGSPFLGGGGFLPPGEGGNNANGGFFYMWHSHNEKEMVNNDIFPGGMMTMMIVEPPSVTINDPMEACQ